MKNFNHPPVRHPASFSILFFSLCCFLISSFLSIQTVQAQLSGTYTIGGENGDFVSFNEAIQAIETNGKTGQLTFNVRPGTYHEQLNLNRISGVTFQGETGDSTEVVLEYDGEYVVLIEDQRDFTFRNMTITGSGEVFRIRGVEETAGNITLESNILKGGSTVISTYNAKRGVYAGNHIYRNNLIIGEGAGISKTRDTHVDWFTGGRLTDNGLEISGNIIQVKGTAIHLYAQEDVVIRDNQIRVEPPLAVFTGSGISIDFVYVLKELSNNILTVHGAQATGIKYFGGTLPHNINNNRIMLPDGGLGLSIVFSSNGWSSGMLVSNNMISVKGHDGSTGIRLESSGDAEFYYNSVLIYGDDATSKALHLALDLGGFGGSEEIPFLNNIFANKAGGYAAYVAKEENDKELSTIISSDYNDFYSSGEALAHFKDQDLADLSQWQNLTGLDAHSLSVDPQFQSAENLVPTNMALDNAGVPIQEVVSDINGKDRENPPSIGAIELEGQAPVVSAGGDKTLTLPTNSVWLRGIAKKVDGRFTAFRWEKVSGPPVSMVGERTANVHLSDLEAGEYIFRFSATDDKGRTGSDEMKLTVISSNQPPVVSVGPDKTVYLPLDQLLLSAMGSDPDGVFRAFQWEKISGPSVTMNQERTANLVLTNLEEGTYVFRFTATDNEGASASDEKTITVLRRNQPPVVSAGGDRTIQVNYPQYQISGIGYDPDGVFRAFRWEKVSGPSVTMMQQNTANLILSDFEVGVYTFRFSATDNEGATSSDEMTLTVTGTDELAGFENSTRITAYPNIFQHHINVAVETVQQDEYQVELYDMLGKVYYSNSFSADPHLEQLHRIDLSQTDMKEGMYLIRVQNRSRSFQKVVKVVKGN